MFGRFLYRLVPVAVVAALYCGAPTPAGAQQRDTVTAASADTLGAEDRLKSKVDSLRRAMGEGAERRRAVSVARLLDEADSLRRTCNFRDALDIYRRALQAATSDELTRTAEEGIFLVQNARSMMNYCTRVKVLDRARFPLDSFFLMFPMEDGGWRPGDDGAPQAYAPSDAGTIYLSKQDENGIRNIYRTDRAADSLWSVPQLLTERTTSTKDEIFPIPDQDGRTLYFASKGLFGMGGYDLYSCRWDRNKEEWGEPVNMGFPYSSPYDDYLFVNTPDGRYSLLASNRDCPKDSVNVYVLEYDALPARSAITDERELRTLTALFPIPDGDDPAHGNDQRASRGAYVSMMESVRALRDSLARHSSLMNAEDETEMRSRLDKAMAALQEIEQEFLSSGAAANNDASDWHAPFGSAASVFSPHGWGKPLDLAFTPAPADRISKLEVLEESLILSFDELPEGLTYQIQLATGTGKMGPEDFNGLSPIYERMSTSLRYTYCAGVFSSYAAALDRLNLVRMMGFDDAVIVASSDGRTVNPS